MVKQLKLKNSKAAFHNIPFSSDFAKSLAQEVRKNEVRESDLIILPSLRSLRKLDREFPKNSIKPKFTTFSDLKNKVLLEGFKNNSILQSELADLVLNILIERKIALSYYDDIFSFIVRFYTFSNNVEFLKDSNHVIYNVLKHLEKELQKRDKKIEQILNLEFANALENQSYFNKTGNKVWLIIPNNNALYIRKIVELLSSCPNANIVFFGLDKEIDWNKKFKGNHPFFIYQEYINKFEINIDDISDIEQSKPSISKLIYSGKYKIDSAKAEFLEFADQFYETQGIVKQVKKIIEENPHSRIAIISDDKKKNLYLKNLFLKFQIEVNETDETGYIEQPIIQLLFEILNAAIDPNKKNYFSLLKNKHFYQKELNIAEIELNEIRKTNFLGDLNTLCNTSLFHNIEKLHATSSYNNVTKALLGIVDEFFVFEEDTQDVRNILINNSGNTYCDLDVYIEFLRRLFSNRKIRKDIINSSKIDITNLIEALYVKYDVVFLTDFNSSKYPLAKNYKRFLNKDQEAFLNIPDKEEEEGLNLFSITALLSSEKVIITCFKEYNGARVEKSYLLEKLNDSLRLEVEPTKQLKLINAFKQPVFKPKKLPQEVYVTAIERLMEDPYAFYYHDVLKIRKLESLDREFSNKEFGIIIHDIISEIEFDKDPNRFIFTFLTLFRFKISRYNVDSEELVWIDKVKKIAIDYHGYQLSILGGIKKIFKEIKGSMKINDITISAKADRIDLKNDGTARIIDFKTGDIPTKNNVQKGIKPQLGIEELILQDGGFNIGTTDVSELLLIKLKGKFKEKDFEDRTIKLDSKVFREELKKLLDKFLRNDAYFFASKSLKASYLSEDYKLLSRQEEWI